MIAQFNHIATIWWHWMGGMFWQVGLLIILVTLIDMAIRRWAWPQVRYVLWGLVFLKLIIPPTWQMPTSVVSWAQPLFEKYISFSVETDEGLTGTSMSLELASLSESSTESPTAPLLAIAFLAWVGGMAVFSLMLARKLSKLRKWQHRQEALDPPHSEIPGWFQELLVETSRRLKLKKVPTVVVAEEGVSPAVFGILHPTILLPKGYLGDLSREQAEHMLFHELCHLKRGDLWIHWFCLVLQIFYWFNPLLIWTRRQMRHVCEICCDLSVADILRDKTRHYRDTLLKNARELFTETVEPSLGLLGLFEEPFRIVSRLRWLEKETWGHRKRKIAATLATSLIMAVFVMPMAGFSQSESQDSENQIIADNLPNEDGVYQIAGVDTPPRVLRAFPPLYPLEAKRNNISGRVLVEFVVTVEGVTRDEWMVESEPPDVFDEAALEAIRQYQFAPGTLNGEPVEVRVKMPVVFELAAPGPLDAEGHYTDSIHTEMPDSPPTSNLGWEGWLMGSSMPAPSSESEELRKIHHSFSMKMEPGLAEEVDTPPMMVGSPPPPPQYPIAAARDKVEGQVVLKFMVDTDGKVKNPEVVEADPVGVFEESALANIEQFEFKPATLNGEPVPCMLNYTIGFELD